MPMARSNRRTQPTWCLRICGLLAERKRLPAVKAIRRDVIECCGGLNIRAFTESIEFTYQPAVLLAAVTPGARRCEPGERWPGERWLLTRIDNVPLPAK